MDYRGTIYKILSRFMDPMPGSTDWIVEARTYLSSLAMPPGALGEIEEAAQKLCAIQKTLKPSVARKLIVLTAADHGVMAQNVSLYPQITDAIVKTALSGGAAINSFCRQSGCDLKIVNAGLNADLVHENLIDCSSDKGTADMSLGPAMTEEDCYKTIEAGIDFAEECVKEYDIIGLGEMGLGNTTAATAVICGLTGWAPSEVAGPGTGVRGEALKHKVSVIEKVLRVNQPSEKHSLDVLAKVGGFEIAFMTGIILGAAAAEKPVVLDGFITSSAALAAMYYIPECCRYMFAGHQSAEPAHARVLHKLVLKPLLKLDMRLGEGTGAALAMNTLEAACDVMNNMLSLEEALKL